MRPTVSEQLEGVSAILTGIVADHLDDDYTRDVLLGAANIVLLLSRTWHGIPEFLRWDSAATAAILTMVGQTPPPPADALDIPALEKHHRHVRDCLEKSMPLIIADEAARAATVRHFRERVARFAFLAHKDN